LVLALGATASGTPTARLGLVNAWGPQWHSRSGGRIDARVALDIRLSRSEEGGPVVDARGAVLGMSTLGAAAEVLVIPSSTIDRVLPQLLNQGHVPHGWLGLGLQPVEIPDSLREVAGDELGMMVMSMAAEGPGARAGVGAGDIALSLNGVPLHRRRHLAAQLDSDSVGKQAELRVIRSGQIVTLQLEIGPRPTR
jgi:S1-C subfamily serine protease